MSESVDKKEMPKQDDVDGILNEKISRRRALSRVAKIGIGVAAVAVAGGGAAAYYYSTQSQNQAPSGGTINLFSYSPLYGPTGYANYLSSTYNITL